ncbi:MAG: lipid II flippase MurJ, partial [Nitrospinota bacterium]
MRGVPDQRPHVSRAAGVVSLATLVSRLLGFVRDILIARAFGSGLAADAFFASFGIANLLRRLFGEGALQASFIPVFASVLQREPRTSARRLAGASFLALGGALLVVTVLGMVLAEPLAWALVPGFGAVPGKLALTARLTRIMFPYLFFIGLSVLAAGVLNAARHFFAPALSPALLNVAMISALLGALAWGAEPAAALAWGAVAGGLLQLLFHLPPLWRTGMWPILSADFGRPEL